MSFIIPLFYRLLYMSIVASIIGITLILLKKITSKEFSAKYNYLMWIIFIVALIFPAVLQSKLSLYNVVDLSSVQNLYMYPEEYAYRNDYSSRENLETIVENNEYKEVKTTQEAELQSTESEIVETEKENDFAKLAKNIVPYIWFIVLILLFTFYIISYFVLKYKVGNEELEDKRVRSILDKAREDLKVKKEFKLIKQNYIKSPALIGIVNPKILVVDGIQEFSDKNLEYIFRHEFSHYKRKDNISSTILAIIKMMYWFNPFIWIIIKAIRKDMELAADEIAVKTLDTNERKEYCKLLVYLSSIYNSGFAEKALGIADDKTNLEKRISTVKITDKITKHPIFSAFLVFIIIGLVCLVLYTNNYYECDLKEPPRLYLKAEDGSEKEFILTSYIWSHKNDVNNFDMGFDENTYDFTEENTIIISNTTDFIVYTNPKHTLKQAKSTWLNLKDGKYSEESYYDLVINPAESLDGSFWGTNGVYILKVDVKDLKNNTANYAIKVLSLNGTDITGIQSLLNTKLSETEKVNKIVSYLSMAKYLDKTEIVGNTLKLIYKYYPGDKSIKGMSTILFTCIDDLENIEYNFSHNKFLKNEKIIDGENEDYEQVKFELIDPIIKTRDEVLSKSKEESNILKGEY